MEEMCKMVEEHSLETASGENVGNLKGSLDILQTYSICLNK